MSQVIKLVIICENRFASYQFELLVIVLVMMMKMLVMMMESPGKRPETKLKKVLKILKESAANIQCRAVTLLLRQR